MHSKPYDPAHDLAFSNALKDKLFPCPALPKQLLKLFHSMKWVFHCSIDSKNCVGNLNVHIVIRVGLNY